MTDKWDASNPEHKAVAHGVEVGRQLEIGECCTDIIDWKWYRLPPTYRRVSTGIEKRRV